jgi:hypothetical protein
LFGGFEELVCGVDEGSVEGVVSSLRVVN